MSKEIEVTTEKKDIRKDPYRNVIFDLETTGTDPIADRITAAGFLDVETKDVTIIMEDDEEKLIQGIMEYIGDGGLRLIGWRIRGFDIPILVIRGLKYRIDTSAKNRIFELSEYFQNSPNRIDSHSLAQFLGLHATDSNARVVPTAFHDGNFGKVAEHLTQDLEMILGIFDILTEVWKI